MRGVRFIQIPTTLLAMVDSSVGGKTAIDIPAGKNLVGAFHQPSFVMIDPGLLKTLPAREFRSGMAEVIKYGAISSLPLFEELERFAKRLAASASGTGADDPALDGVIASCIRIKADVVSEDEFDTGRRQILNFGHTFGHALEVRGGFSKYTHGEAVAVGMRIAARYGEAAGITEAGTAARLDALLDAFGLTIFTSEDSTEMLSSTGIDHDVIGSVTNAVVGTNRDETEPTHYAELIPYIKNDKKASGGMVNLVLLKRLGEAVIVPVALTELEASLRGLNV
jgi:3-dehydroquinate synthase